MKKRVLWVALIILSFASLFIGVSDISIGDLFTLSEQQLEILWISRIPRLISIIIAGAGISVCGLILQQLTRNRFVSPTTAGTMDAARLGILVSLLLFTSASPLLKMGIAFLFALMGTFFFMLILKRIRFKDTIFIPLVGLMLGSVLSSIATFIAYQYDLIQNMSSWLQGDFSMMLEGRYELLYVSLPALLLAYLFANRFTIAGMGEEFAKNLGLRYQTVVNIGLILVALVTSSVVLTVGMIPFLGLIIPNLVSIYQGDHLQRILPHIALLGAVFVLFCDILGRIMIYPYEISISLMVGVIGSGIFIYLLMRRKSHAS